MVLWFALNGFMYVFDVMLVFAFKRLSAILRDDQSINQPISQLAKKTDSTVDLPWWGSPRLTPSISY